MKMLVQPADSFNVPSSAAKLSTVRQEVVPTQITRPPFRLVSLMIRAVSSGIMQYSECISCSEMSSAFTGRKVPSPTWREMCIRDRNKSLWVPVRISFRISLSLTIL